MTDTPLVERLRGLIERLEKLEGPDREVDAMIWCLDHGFRFIRISDDNDYSPAYRDVEPGPQYKAGGHSKTGSGYLIFYDPSPSVHPHRRHHYQLMGNWTSYTASLDAVVALVERVLPGWKWRVSSNQGEVFQRDPECGHDGYAATPAIALVIATLRALSQEQSK